MKKVFCVLAVVALFLVSFSGCKGDKTYTELLTQKNGWVLSSATSAPAYHMQDGSYAGDLINDGYLEDFEAAYILFFNENGSEILKPGKVVAPEDFDPEWCYREETSLGNWSFDNADNPEYINMQVPFFYDEDVEKCQVLALTADEFRIKCTINDDSPVSKGTYSFTLTYVPAK